MNADGRTEVQSRSVAASRRSPQACARAHGTGLREFACSVLEVVARDPESLEVELLGVLPRDLPLRQT